MTRLKGRRALVTGATSGIGKAIAEDLAKEGCRLILAGRRRARLQALGRRLKAEVLVLDVRDRRAVDRAEPGAVEILVNAAGLARGLSSLQEGSVDDWEEMIDANLKGLLYLTRKVLPGMVRRRRGHVLNLGSTAGHWAYPGGAVYCATKAAVKRLTEAMRMDLLGTGIRVTSIDPGMVETEFSEVRFHVDLQQVVVTPTDQASVGLDHRRKAKA